jgi:pimeloyl-ACP methyl ester carboxylesterase
VQSTNFPKDLIVDSGGVRLAVRDYGGKGRPLIFVHGGPGPNLASWDEFARSLTQSLRCIAYDQGGHGQSDDASDYSYSALTGDISAIVDALALRAPIIVGHSWGGIIALAYAGDQRDCADVIAVDGLATGISRRLRDEELNEMAALLRSNPLFKRTFEFVGTEDEANELLAWCSTHAPEHHPKFSEAAFRRSLVRGSGISACRPSKRYRSH